MEIRIRLLAIVILSLGANVGLLEAQQLNAPSMIASQELLPASTKAWLSVPNATRLDEKFLQTDLGRLSQDEKLAPFIESAKAQLQEWIVDKNMRLGLSLEDVQDVRSGEICFAGILPTPPNPENEDEWISRGEHGLVMLVDVSETVEEANALLGRLAESLTERGAVRENYGDVFGATVSKWKFPRKSRLVNHRFVYQTITGGWLLSSDNENIFREVVRRLVNIGNVSPNETLASQSAFRNVMSNVQLEGIQPDLYWYVNPFGYFQLARAMARDEEEIRQKKGDDWARILRKMGFDGFQGVGGFIALATEKSDLLHRSFVYRPADGQDIKQKRIFGLFDFTNKKRTPLVPPGYVPDTISGYLCASWDMQLALKNVEYAVDMYLKKEGSFKDTLENLRVEMNVDIPDVVDKFDNELIVITETELPVTETSERVIFAIRLNDDVREYMTRTLQRSWPSQHEVIEYGGYKIIRIKDSVGYAEPDPDDKFQDPDFGDQFPVDEVEEEEDGVRLFETRFCASTDKYLYVANNDEHLLSMLAGGCQNPLTADDDYLRVSAVLAEMTDESRISMRQFNRPDRVIRANYEMIRQGKMAASDTMLARLLNHLFQTRNKGSDSVRTQKLDGSKLPADFKNDVAPYFGPAGWVMESTRDGWLFTGVTLKRDPANK